MQASQIPVKFGVAFAANAGGAFTHQVPTPSQVLITPGAASMTTGFPPLNFTAVASGGIPPFGADFNGLLNQISAWNQWQNAGGLVPYDATFQTAIGGYPIGATIESATATGTIWVSTADNNTTNPDTGGAGWVNSNILFYTVATGSVNAWTASLKFVPVSLFDGLQINIQFPTTNTASSPTLNLNGLGTKTIFSNSGNTLFSSGLTVNAILRYSSGLGGWFCINSSTATGWQLLASAVMTATTTIITNIPQNYSNLMIIANSTPPTTISASNNNGTTYFSLQSYSTSANPTIVIFGYVGQALMIPFSITQDSAPNIISLGAIPGINAVKITTTAPSSSSFFRVFGEP
jgi:hypothetical protein